MKTIINMLTGERVVMPLTTEEIERDRKNGEMMREIRAKEALAEGLARKRAGALEQLADKLLQDPTILERL